MSFIQKNVKGILLCLVLAIPCWFLGQAVPVVGGPVFGILAGMLITLLLKDKTQFQSGITFVSKKVLQYAVILLGFGLNLSVILETGKQEVCHESQKLLYYGKYYRQTVAEWGKWLGVSAGCELQSDVYGPSCGIL